jgi:hypothetical protein
MHGIGKRVICRHPSPALRGQLETRPRHHQAAQKEVSITDS